MTVMRVVSVSGGKDSTCVYLWACDEFGKDGFESVFADTGHEHPVTYNYIRNLARMTNGPEIHEVRSDFSDRIIQRNEKRISEGKQPRTPTGNPFMDLMLWKSRAPSTKSQFCTEHLKLAPIRDWIEARRGDRELEIYLGIRHGESKRRSTLPPRDFNKYNDGYINRPILTWSEADVFAYLKAKGIPPNPLYEAGFSRVGCFPCIHARKSELARLPDWAWDKLEEWEKLLGRTWFPAGLVPGIHIVSVKEAREWSKTTHGGRQYDLLAEDAKDVPSCMSTWGACE